MNHIIIIFIKLLKEYNTVEDFRIGGGDGRLGPRNPGGPIFYDIKNWICISMIFNKWGLR